jgi:hypothetical protein
MREKLQQFTDIVIMTVVILLGFVVVRNYLFTSAPHETSLPRGRLNPPKGVDWTDQDVNLLIAMKVGCSACSESIPFYARLVKMAEMGEIKVAIQAVFPNDEESTRNYLASEGFVVKTATGASLKELQLSATPTLVLMKRDGSVVKAWVGVLSPKREVEVIDTIRALTEN